MIPHELMKTLYTARPNDLCNDTRKLNKGDVFLAYPGAAFDGRRFIQDAIAKGASMVIYDPSDFDIKALTHSSKVGIFPLINLGGRLDELAKHYYPVSEGALNIIGITGTNGKTTIAYQLAQAYSLLNTSCQYIGTLGIGEVGALQPLNNTTPDALFIQKFLHNCIKKNQINIAMEVSSHALALGRVKAVDFKHAIYTNLSREHLDFHGTMTAYAHAKARLFTYPNLTSAIINLDDDYAEVMRASCPAHMQTAILTYGIHRQADVKAVNIELSMKGTVFKIHTPWGEVKAKTRQIGLFSVYNTLALCAQLLQEGFAISQLESILPQLKSSPGRMESIPSEFPSAPTVFVDYAHTPDALENTLKALCQLKSEKSQLILVFGCGGGRDIGKRMLMGRIAARFADQVILTNDNPRFENPDDIIVDIQKGFLNEMTPHEVELDRATAIQRAIEQAKACDVVLIAGKGHEDYQEVNGKRVLFSDASVVSALLG